LIMTILTIKLMGGLGNQLFEIFTTMAHAIRNGMEFKFQNCKSLLIGTVRPTYWENLLDELKPFLTDQSNLNFKNYNELAYTYNMLPNFTDDTMLFGYFQSLKYFEQELPLILNILHIDDKICAMRHRYAELFNGSSFTSMHFRITGYRCISDCHPVAPYEYYSQAINTLNPSHILFFHQPEDEEEVLQHINRLSQEFPGIMFIQAPQDLEDWEQLLLMACCDRHIIPNSSFSWWGAVLASSKSVCYPLNWFGPNMTKTHNFVIKDMVLPSWIGI